jgi:hypothetical protein
MTGTVTEMPSKPHYRLSAMLTDNRMAWHILECDAGGWWSVLLQDSMVTDVFPMHHEVFSLLEHDGWEPIGEPTRTTGTAMVNGRKEFAVFLQVNVKNKRLERHV